MVIRYLTARYVQTCSKNSPKHDIARCGPSSRQQRRLEISPGGKRVRHKSRTAYQSTTMESIDHKEETIKYRSS
jgi:hypothetical protein